MYNKPFGSDNAIACCKNCKIHTFTSLISHICKSFIFYRTTPGIMPRPRAFQQCIACM